MTDNWLIQSKRSGLYVVADGDWHDRRHLNIEWVADASKATRFTNAKAKFVAKRNLHFGTAQVIPADKAA